MKYSVLLRPIKYSDLDALLNLALEAQYGITSLPKQRDFLEKKISLSINSFAKEIEGPENESYLFVLENIVSKEILGTCGIISQTSIREPFYSFELQTIQNASPSLHIYKEHSLLYLHRTKHTPTEICSLFLTQKARNKGLAKLLSLSRFIFMQVHSIRFNSTVVAKMRGIISKEGISPFWEHILKPFFTMTFAEADLLRLSNTEFITDLIPKNPIYIDLLPKEVQEVIAKIHPNTIPALKILEKQGFKFSNKIDIFDGGPNYYAPLKEIHSVKHCKSGYLHSIVKKNPSSDILSIVCNPKIHFLSAYGYIQENSSNKVTLSEELVKTLKLEIDDPVAYLHLGTLP
ncbi:MAG: arginine N-succinyltransferase [Chlamydiales bacterium]|nr:arginine N-succinyltransferase [Chlamydiales bacterium]